MSAQSPAPAVTVGDVCDALDESVAELTARTGFVAATPE